MAEITNEQRKKIIKVELLETFAELVDTLYGSPMGASGQNHAPGQVPDPGATAGTSKYLREDGTWQIPVDIPLNNNNHDYVEIGGVKWATMNVGANSIIDYGLYFQWGDTQGYTAAQVGSGSGQKPFGWADYKYGNGTSSPRATGMTKYNSTDGKTVLDLADDGVRANWGGNWRMPTTDEYAALGTATTSAWTADYQGSGVAGLVLTDKTDSSKVLFFPAAGRCSNGSVSYVGSDGLYWSSSVISSSVQYAYYLYFNSSGVRWQPILNRCHGFSVRGVLDDSNSLHKVAVSGDYNDLSNKPNTDKFIETTWFNLKSLRDSSLLVPGLFYRIIDYVTTTTQEFTQSAGHKFDIIVQADDVNILNENAHAAKPYYEDLEDLGNGYGSGYYLDENQYFANSKLESWEIKYCLDNDVDRFTWADDEDGKGVIYYMKDEFGNECPYDFKNIMFKRWKITAITTSSTVVTENFLLSMSILFVGRFHSYTSSTIQLINDDKISVIVDSNDSKYFYTFSLCTNDWETFDHSDDAIFVVDGSLKKYSDHMYANNIIKEYVLFNRGYYSDKLKLNNIVFKPISNADGDYCKNNVFGEGCYNITLGNIETINNSFGNDCYNNLFGESCWNNSFGNNFQDNFLGTNYYSNFFGSYCHYNSFGNNCGYNSFGSNCYCNFFRNNCYYNSFGSNNHHNILGEFYLNNSFGNYCNYNSFGNYCLSNSFGNECNSNSFGNSCNYNSFGNLCNHNSFSNNCNYNLFGNICEFINLQKDYMLHNIVESGNVHINVTSTQTTSSINKLRNITIAQGVNNKNTVKTISHNTVNDTFKTTYQAPSSTTINI